MKIEIISIFGQPYLWLYKYSIDVQSSNTWAVWVIFFSEESHEQEKAVDQQNSCLKYLL